jgi:hypothetical protein
MSSSSTQPVSTQPVPAGPVPASTQPVPAPGKMGLGRALSVHRGLPLQWSELLFVFIPASLLVIAPLSYGLWRAWYAYTTFGPAAASAWARPWYLFATLALVPFSLLAVRRMFLASRYVAVHENGLRLRLSPFSNLPLTWDEITGIAAAAYQDHFLGMVLQMRPQVVIYPAKGRPIRLDGRFQKVTSLTRRVKSNLYPRLWPAMCEQLQAGQPVQFGRLAVHPQALYLGERPIPWEQVTRLSTHSGYLVIELQTGGPVRTPVVQIPNLELMLQLVEWGINS